MFLCPNKFKLDQQSRQQAYCPNIYTVHCCPGYSLALKYALFYRYFLSRNALHTCKKAHSTSVHVICKIATLLQFLSEYFEGNTEAISLICR